MSWRLYGGSKDPRSQQEFDFHHFHRIPGVKPDMERPARNAARLALDPVETGSNTGSSSVVWFETYRRLSMAFGKGGTLDEHGWTYLKLRQINYFEHAILEVWIFQQNAEINISSIFLRSIQSIPINSIAIWFFLLRTLSDCVSSVNADVPEQARSARSLDASTLQTLEFLVQRAPAQLS